jgi:hypothetical protein
MKKDNTVLVPVPRLQPVSCADVASCLSLLEPRTVGREEFDLVFASVKVLGLFRRRLDRFRELWGGWW